MLRTLVASVVLAFFLSVSQAQLAYPDTRTVEFTETHHGITVADPYRWLEGDVRESSEVADWVAAQNEVTFAYLNAIEGKDRLRRELGDRIAYDRIGIPFRVGERYTVSHSDGVRDHRIVHIIDDLSELSDIDNARVLLNPNEWSDDGSTSLAGTSFTRDGKLLAYSVSESGSDWRTWKFMDVETGEHLEDELRWVRYSGVSWDLHSEGVYYAAYPEPEDSTYTTQALGRKIMYHRLGTPQSDDVVVYDLGGGTTESPYVWTSENGRWLFFGRSVTGVTANEIRVHDLAKGFGTIDDALDLFVGLDGVYSTIGVDDTTLYVYTEFEAPNGRVISIDMANPEGGWDEVVPEQETSLRSAELVGSTLVLRRLVDAHTKVFIHRLDGALVRELSLPGIGTASGFDGRSRDTGTFFAFTSFDRPTEVWHYDLLTDRSELLWSPDAGFDPSEYTVKQVFFHSADGTRVPMFVTHRRDIELNGTNPTVLYGYGGFNIPQTPYFSSARSLWLDMGGVYAVANIRGGGEYGREWHLGATKLNKQRSYDDFIGAAETLIKKGYTSSDFLAIQGGSNGGLLVGAVMTQRPELFGAALPAVGVMDLLRFHAFTIGYGWKADYGDIEKEDEFRNLHKLSPYHALLRNGSAEYPPTLVTTSDTDDRVVPAHSFKFAAALQANQSGDAPVLIRIETSAGHGGGVALEKHMDGISDQYAFLVDVFGIDIPEHFGMDE